MNHTENEDSTLLRQLRTGDVIAFRQLYTHYWRRLYAAAYNRLRDGQMAEDIVQDVFVDLWEKRQHLFIQQSFAVYMLTAVRYKVLDHIRRSVVREQFIQRMLAGIPEGLDTTEQLMAYQELQTALDEQVQRLPDQRRLIYELSRRDHLTYAEIAERLSLSPKTVENQLSRALKTLRTELSELLTVLIVLCQYHDV